MDGKHSATVDALLEKVKLYEGLRILQIDVPFLLEFDVGQNGYGETLF